MLILMGRQAGMVDGHAWKKVAWGWGMLMVG
jgi:hypothetical protein